MAGPFVISVESLNKSVSAVEGQSILDALLRDEIWIPHSCTQGTCGSCKVRVIEGNVDHRASPLYTLSQEERDGGVALACQSCALSNTTIVPINSFEIDDRMPRHKLADYDGVVASIERVSGSVYRLGLKLDVDMQFNPGQYAELEIPGTGIRRQYSMSNRPLDEVVTFDLKYVSGGVASEWLVTDAQIGDPIRVTGPYGQFGFHTAQSGTSVILLAGGTGLAPMRPIIWDVLSNDLVESVYLYHGDREASDLYDVEFFRELERSDKRFIYRPALSRGPAAGWDGAIGRVTDLVVEDFATCRGMSALICGSPGFVESASRSLKRRRMAPRLVVSEEFTHAIIENATV